MFDATGPAAVALRGGHESVRRGRGTVVTGGRLRTPGRPLTRWSAAATQQAFNSPAGLPWIAAERSEGYDATDAGSPGDDAAAGSDGGFAPAAGTVAAAVAKLREAHAELAALDLADVHDEDLREGLVALSDTIQRVGAQHTRLLGAVDRRQAYTADACVSTASWLRFRTRWGYGACKKAVKRGWLLGRMPRLAAAYLAGEVTAEHVDAIAHRAIGGRVDAITACDQTLTDLAKAAEPAAVRTAVQHIIDAAATDPDGADDPAPCTNEDLRGVTVRPGFAELGDLDGATTPVLSALLGRAFDVFDQPDPAGTDNTVRRSAAQRRHDALVAALTVALDASAGGATFGGVIAHLVVFADAMTLMGRDDLATIAPHIAGVGGITPELARHLAATTDPSFRAVLSLGRWLPVGVTRAQRTLPDWLRPTVYAPQLTCAGPGCDVPAVLCEADHREPYAAGGATSADNTDPMCAAHNQLKHDGGWTVTFDWVTGTHTWTGRNGKTITVEPKSSSSTPSHLPTPRRT